MDNIRFGSFTLSVSQRRLWHEGKPVALKPKEINLLALLVERRPATVSRDEIIERIWDGTATDAAVSQTIYRLRRTLQRYDFGTLIHTVPDAGFQFAGGTPLDARKDLFDFLRPSFDAYQQAAFLYRQRTGVSILESIEILRSVCTSNPTFTPALVLLAKAYTNAGIRLLYPPRDAYWRARVALEHAIHHDSSNADAYATLATLQLFFRNDLVRASEAVERAQLFAPSSPVTRVAAVWERLARRDFAGAVTQADHAVCTSPASAHCSSMIGVSLYAAERFDEAKNAFSTALRLNSRNSTALFYDACIATLENDFDRALTQLRHISGHDILPRIVGLRGYIGARIGDSSEFAKALEHLSSYESSCAMSIAAVLIGADDYSGAAEALRTAVDAREPALFLTLADPVYAPMRQLYPELFEVMVAQKPRACDRCGTQLPGIGSLQLQECDFCWECRSVARTPFQ